MKLFFAAIGLVLIFEGLPYFLNPDGMKNMARFIVDLEPSTLRVAGLGLMVAGLILLYLFIPA
ncbi:MAG: DUF2065 domain-containing protein [Nitrospinota bacterium]|nr:DUF2065 domain-containing protein [Nitrospinota bacterium]